MLRQNCVVSRLRACGGRGFSVKISICREIWIRRIAVHFPEVQVVAIRSGKNVRCRVGHHGAVQGRKSRKTGRRRRVRRNRFPFERHDIRISGGNLSNIFRRRRFRPFAGGREGFVGKLGAFEKRSARRKTVVFMGGTFEMLFHRITENRTVQSGNIRWNAEKQDECDEYRNGPMRSNEPTEFDSASGSSRSATGRAHSDSFLVKIKIVFLKNGTNYADFH